MSQKMPSTREEMLAHLGKSIEFVTWNVPITPTHQKELEMLSHDNRVALELTARETYSFVTLIAQSGAFGSVAEIYSWMEKCAMVAALTGNQSAYTFLSAAANFMDEYQEWVATKEPKSMLDSYVLANGGRNIHQIRKELGIPEPELPKTDTTAPTQDPDKNPNLN